MSINGLNSNQILTLMQLESGKTYTFVGTTGNYDNYMCVTAGMFEAPAEEVYYAYKINIYLKIDPGTAISVSQFEHSDWVLDDPTTTYLACGGIYNREELINWYEQFFNSDINVLSFNEGSQYSFVRGGDVYEPYHGFYNFQECLTKDNGGIFYKDGVIQSSGYRSSLYLGMVNDSTTNYLKTYTATGEDTSFYFDYPLYINDGSNSYKDYFSVLYGNNGGDFDYYYQESFKLTLKFDNFYARPTIYNGYGRISVLNDDTVVTTDSQGRKTLERLIYVVLSEDVGFLHS